MKDILPNRKRKSLFKTGFWFFNGITNELVDVELFVEFKGFRSITLLH